MLYRITVNRWHNHDTAWICNGNLKQTYVRYTPDCDPENRLLLRKLENSRGLSAVYADLVRVALITGPYATLWIGDLKGTIAPMDVQPQGWTYPNGEVAEPSFFWQWHPSDDTEDKIIRDLSDANPFRKVLEGEEPKYLKGLVPYAKDRKHGKIDAIQAFPILKLPEMLRPDLQWTFEFDGPSIP